MDRLFFSVFYLGLIAGQLFWDHLFFYKEVSLGVFADHELMKMRNP